MPNPINNKRQRSYRRMRNKLPNVTVHENSVIAAGSVVTKDVPPETVVKGVPAKPMMTRQEYETKRRAFIEARKTV